MDTAASSPHRGILVVLLVAVAVISLFGFSAYYLFFRSGPAIKESVFAQFDDPLIRKHLAAQANQAKQRFISQFQDRPQLIFTEADNGGPQPAGLQKVTEGDKLISEVISIGSTYYVKDLADQTWWQQTLIQDVSDETTGSQLFSPATYFKELTKVTSETSYAALGQEACGSLTCYKYEQKEQGVVSAIIWFDSDQLLLQKSERFLPEGKFSSQYTYQDVTLGAPAKTKPVPEGRSITDYIATPNSSGDEPSSKLTPEQQQRFEEIQRQLGNQ